MLAYHRESPDIGRGAVARQTLATGDLLHPLAHTAAVLGAERDGEIIGQGDAARYCFQILRGCVRTVRLLEDGRRQLGEFLLAGDIFGWDTLGPHEFAAEAVTSVAMRRFSVATIEARAVADPVFAHALRRYSAGQIRQARGRLVLLGRKTAGERIATFLLEMRDRLPEPEGGGIDLPMSRTDVADYLGLTIETVCRGLTELRRRGLIDIDRTRIVIRDEGALEEAGSDRLH